MLRPLLRYYIQRLTISLSYQRAFPLTRRPHYIIAAVVVVVIGSATTTRIFECREFCQKVHIELFIDKRVN